MVAIRRSCLEMAAVTRTFSSRSEADWYRIRVTWLEIELSHQLERYGNLTSFADCRLKPKVPTWLARR